MNKQSILVNDGINLYQNILKSSEELCMISDCYTVRYIISGEVCNIIEGVEEEHKAGGILILPPFSYSASVCEKAPYSDFVIAFRAADISAEANELLRRVLKPTDKFGIYYPCVSESAVSLIGRFKDYLISNIHDKNAYYRILLNELLLLLSESKAQISEKHIIGKGAEYIEYINDFLYANVAVKRLAKRFFTTDSAICHEFKNHNRISPHAYTVIKRVLHAKMLIEEGMRPCDAAERVGFKTYSVFYRAYIKYVGKAPSADKKGKRK